MNDTKPERNNGSGDVVVSVIMLTYNHERYVRQALDSVLMQNVDFGYEILVGDDASTDGTIEILREYEAKNPGRVNVFLSEENQGTTKNAYRLFLQARGKYLASCEGDDYWTDPNKLQTQVDFMEKHLEYIGCSHPVECVDVNGEPIKGKKLRWVSNKKRYTLKRDFKGIFLPGHSSSLLRRNIFLEPKGDYTVFWKYSKYVGDRTAAVLWGVEGDFYRLDRTMSCYRSQTAADGKNVTSLVYVADEEKNEKELELTRKLEMLTSECLGKNVSFDYYKCKVFLSAVYRSVSKRNAKEWNVAKAVWREIHNSILAVVRLPIMLIDMAIEKMTG